MTKLLKISSQCAIPTFEGLFLESHNTQVMQLLFHFAHRHALTKLRLHSDETLALLDNQMSILDHKLCKFQESSKVFNTQELRWEVAARNMQALKQSKQHTPLLKVSRESSAEQQVTGKETSLTVSIPQSVITWVIQGWTRVENLNTYKIHALSDYVVMIWQFGTMDFYFKESVSIVHDGQHRHSLQLRVSLHTAISRPNTGKPPKRGIRSNLLRLNTDKPEFTAFRKSWIPLASKKFLSKV